MRSEAQKVEKLEVKRERKEGRTASPRVCHKPPDVLLSPRLKSEERSTPGAYTLQLDKELENAENEQNLDVRNKGKTQ